MATKLNESIMVQGNMLKMNLRHGDSAQFFFKNQNGVLCGRTKN